MASKIPQKTLGSACYYYQVHKIYSMSSITSQVPYGHLPLIFPSM